MFKATDRFFIKKNPCRNKKGKKSHYFGPQGIKRGLLHQQAPIYVKLVRPPGPPRGPTGGGDLIIGLGTAVGPPSEDGSYGAVEMVQKRTIFSTKTR